MTEDSDSLKEIKKLLDELKKSEMFTDDALSSFSQIFEYSVSLSNRTFDLEKRLVKQANEEIESVELLYKNKKYSTSTYFLQQSTEKIAKAWVLFLGFIKEKELTQVSHKTPRLFLKAFKSKIGSISVQLIHSVNSNYIIEIDALEKTINKGDEIASLTLDQINQMLEALNMLEVLLKKELKKYETVISSKMISELMDYMMSLMWIYILAIITFPHAETTRYPDVKGSENTLEPSDYNSNLGIVQATPVLIPKLKSSGELLSKYLRSVDNKNRSCHGFS